MLPGMRTLLRHLGRVPAAAVLVLLLGTPPAATAPDVALTSVEPQARPAAAPVMAAPIVAAPVVAAPRAAAPVVAAPRAAAIRLHRVATGLSSPVFVTSAPDGTGRLFIVEKTGTIRIYRNAHVLAAPFLDISAAVSHGSEQGLLGLAFHPDFATNHRLFVDFTNRSGNTVVREYRVSRSRPNRVDAATGRTILRINQPYSNHNGGMLAFGPDGDLYISAGDGGSAGDPGNRAQSISSLLGKILRIDVNRTSATHRYRSPGTNPYVGRPGRNEIWQRGLRNPWRFSFDRATGALWIGDVGQNRYEEVDRAAASVGGAGRGVNWGWRVLEGFACYNPSTGCSTSGRTPPLLAYSHATNGRCAITGGYVYRGSLVPALVGGYVYGDYCSGEIWVVPAGATSPSHGTRLLDTSLLVSSFGEGGRGELFVCDLRGNLYKVLPA
jgi:glucose/arabinose dehydrogenase